MGSRKSGGRLGSRHVGGILPYLRGGSNINNISPKSTKRGRKQVF